MKFTLEIEINNSEIKTGNDLAITLVKISKALNQAYNYYNPIDLRTATVEDRFGNIVAEWKIEE
jgi:hypothetical protein